MASLPHKRSRLKERLLQQGVSVYSPRCTHGAESTKLPRPSSREQPLVPSTDLKNAYPEPTQRWVKSEWGAARSFFPPGTVSRGGTVSHRDNPPRVILTRLTHLHPFGLRGHDSAVGMTPGLILPRAHGHPGDKSVQATAPGNTGFFPGKKE